MPTIRTVTILFAIALTGGAATAQDAARGEQVFRKCAGCHQAGPDAVNRVGPILTGVIGRPAAAVPGYAYSRSLKSAADTDLVWTPQNIFEWLENPTKFLRTRLDDSRARAKMTFRLGDPTERQDVIAFLASQ